MVLAEANACSVPVVAYRSGGVVEVIDDGENGFLVEAYNKNVLYDKVRLLISDGKLRNKMGFLGRKKVEKKFIWANIVSHIEKSYSLYFKT